jgi:hypothetical protein
MSAVRDLLGKFTSSQVTTPGVEVHNYARYSRGGCRCETCKAAKAEYVRTRRAATAGLRKQAAAAGQVYIAQGISHGYSGYRDASCRCSVCWRAAKASRVIRGRRIDATAGAR